MTKWHTQVAHMAKHMNMVGFLGPWAPPTTPDCNNESVSL